MKTILNPRIKQTPVALICANGDRLPMDEAIPMLVRNAANVGGYNPQLNHNGTMRLEYDDGSLAYCVPKHRYYPSGKIESHVTLHTSGNGWMVIVNFLPEEVK